MDVSYAVHLNGLVILTSALFAFAKYLDSNHIEEIKNFKDKIRDDEKLQPVMPEAQNLWDTICNEQPVSLKKHIKALIAIFIYLACLHAALLLFALFVDPVGLIVQSRLGVSPSSLILVGKGLGKFLLLLAVICLVRNAWKLFYSRQKEMEDKMTKLMNMEQELELMIGSYRKGYKDANNSANDSNDDIPS